jgi:hypothetical protein
MTQGSQVQILVPATKKAPDQGPVPADTCVGSEPLGVCPAGSSGSHRVNSTRPAWAISCTDRRRKTPDRAREVRQVRFEL